MRRLRKTRRCLSSQVESPKPFDFTRHIREDGPMGGSQTFSYVVEWEAMRGDEGLRIAFRDATPEAGWTQSHCPISLSIQLTLHCHQGQDSQFNMVAGRGQLTGCNLHTNDQYWSTDTLYISTSFKLQCYRSVLCLSINFCSSFSYHTTILIWPWMCTTI